MKSEELTDLENASMWIKIWRLRISKNKFSAIIIALLLFMNIYVIVSGELEAALVDLPQELQSQVRTTIGLGSIALMFGILYFWFGLDGIFLTTE